MGIAAIIYFELVVIQTLAEIFMEQYFTFGIILLIVTGSTWQYVRLKRLSERKIIADYSLRQSRSSLKWTKFILPTIFLCSGLYGSISIFLVLTAALLFISTIVERLLTSKYEYDAFTIRGDILTMNEFKTKDFNLEELTIIDFLPFGNSFKLKFKNGQSLSIHRPDFQNESLIIFLNIAIGKSKLQVVISDDAKSKIYISETASA
ncbi:hypothetical protein BH11BAC3_BH11BAC3_12160 [soil metagenome]